MVISPEEFNLDEGSQDFILTTDGDNGPSRRNTRSRARNRKTRRRRSQSGRRRSNNDNRTHASRGNNNQNNNNKNKNYRKSGMTPEEEEQEEKNRQEVSDNIYYKENNTFRIAGINIQGLPTINDDGDGKNEAIREAIELFEIDTICMQEVNRDWYTIDENHRWHQRIKHWWESRHTSIAFNTIDIERKEHQPGGNIITSRNDVVYRTTKDKEQDSTKLGRWTSVLFKGKNTVKTRIISAYRPCVTSKPGEKTVHSQHQRYLDLKKINKTPRKAFLDDLGDAINRWQNNGEQIILVADMNTDVRSQEIVQWAQQHGLRESMTHDNDYIVGTQNRGRKPIDGIWVSYSIQIIRRGYGLFGDFPCDHRFIFIDIMYRNAFGHIMAPICNPAARRLKTDNIPCTKKWLQVYTFHIKRQKIHERLFKLEAKCNSLASGASLPQKLQDEYNSIMTIRHECIKIADKKCRKLYMSRKASCPESSVIKKSILLLKGAISRKKGARVSLSYIKRLETTTDIHNVHLISIEELETTLGEKRKALFKLNKDPEGRRFDYLTEKARHVAAEKDLELSKVITQMRDREKTSESHRKIQIIRGKINSGGLTKVIIQGPDGENIDVTDKEGIEKACLEENDKKYHQTEDTPPMQEPLLSLLGRTAETSFAKEILEGTATFPPEIDQHTRELLQEMKKPTTSLIPYIPTITAESFSDGWKKMKEKTSAGISGLHFGHLIAATKDPFITEVESCIAHIPYRTGMSPDMWKSSLIVMMKKKGKEEDVKTLRSVVLQEADGNFINKNLGREAMRIVEKYNLLPEEQYGSRPGRTSIDHAVHKRLWYDIIRQMRYPGIMVSNDAKSCYDRVVHSIASLAFQRIGIPIEPVRSMLITIQEMKHHIRSAYGESEESITSIGADKFYQGILQGNGASPTTWALVSTPLINMMRTAGNGTFLQSPISKQISLIAALAFVDDTDLPNAELRREISLEELLDRAQKGLTRWEGGLKGTGGALRPDKSWAYIIDFFFNEKGEWKYKDIDEIDMELLVKDHEETVHALQILQFSKAKETLGVWLAPDGNNDKQVQVLIDKANEWAADIRTGHLNIEDSWRALNSTIIMSLKYPMPALTLSKKQCTQIMKPVLISGLNSLGMSRNFPRDLVYGSKDFGGRGITDIYHFQGISYWNYILKHLNSDSITGKFIRCSLEAAMIEAGVGDLIFYFDYNKYGFLLCDSWVKAAWKYQSEEKIKIEQEVILPLKFNRENDPVIMEDFVESSQFTKADLKKANRCRHYLQVTFLSEITDGFGEEFTKTFKGEKDETRQPRYIYPRQDQPNQTIFRVWRRLLKKTFTDDNGKIIIDLGPWYNHFANSYKWKILTHYPYTLYEIRGNRIKAWKRSTQRGGFARRQTYVYWQEAIGLPRHLRVPTIERKDETHIRVTGYADTIQDASFPSLMKKWGSPYILQQAEVADQTTIQKILTALSTKTLNVVEDGSYFREYGIGAAAWFIDNGTEILLRGTCRVPGEKWDMNSYRSELYGILCGILHLLYSLRGIENIIGEVLLGSDGKGALDAIRHKFATTDTNRKHFDIIDSIWKMMNSAPSLKWNYVHIESHQDDFTPFSELDRLSQLNVLADEAAKEVCYKIIEDNDTDPIFCYLPFQKIELSIDGKNISGECVKFMTKHIQEKRAKNYWYNKFEDNDIDFQSIDWETFNQACNKYERQLWLSKHITGFCGVGVQLVRYHHQTFANCPRCNFEAENTIHVLQCPHPEARTIWNRELVSLQEKMKKEKFDPQITEQIIHNLTAWHQDLPPPPLPHDPEFAIVIIEQRNITWKRLIDGFYATGWREKQENFMKTNRDTRSAKKLIVKLIRWIWHIAWRLWEHRNDTLHNQGDKTNKKELEDTNEMINLEWLEGQAELPERYSHLFSGTIQDRLKMDIQRKQQWLTSVWLARQHHEILVLPEPEENAAVKKFERWLKNREPRELQG